MHAALLALSVINTLFTFLILAGIGRLARDSDATTTAFIAGYNIQNQRLRELAELIESNLDAVLTLDARASQSSQDGDAE